MMRPLAVYRAAILSVAAMLSVSCWQPIFEPSVSASAFMVKKLGNPVWTAEVAVAKTFDGGYFVPPRDRARYGEGFWINRKNEWELQVGYLDISNSLVLSSYPSVFYLKDEAYPGGIVRSAGAAANILYVGMDKVHGIVRADRRSVWNPWTVNSLVGLGIAPDIRTDRDVIALLSWPVGSDAMYLSRMTVSGLETVYPPDPLPPPATLAKTPPQRFLKMAFAGINPSDSSLIVSGSLADETVHTYRWSPPLETAVPTELTGISQQITGILSDGRLMADVGSMLYLYTKDGAFSQAIDTGPLRFAHERPKDASDPTSAAISVFVRSLRIGVGRNEKIDYRIEIYEIPTKDLGRLSE